MTNRPDKQRSGQEIEADLRITNLAGEIKRQLAGGKTIERIQREIGSRCGSEGERAIAFYMAGLTLPEAILRSAWPATRARGRRRRMMLYIALTLVFMLDVQMSIIAQSGGVR